MTTSTGSGVTALSGQVALNARPQIVDGAKLYRFSKSAYISTTATNYLTDDANVVQGVPIAGLYLMELSATSITSAAVVASIIFTGFMGIPTTTVTIGFVNTAIGQFAPAQIRFYVRTDGVATCQVKSLNLNTVFDLNLSMIRIGD